MKRYEFLWGSVTTLLICVMSFSLSAKSSMMQFTCGDLHIIAMCDGYLPLPATDFLAHDQALQASLLEDLAITVPINMYLINTGKERILVDVGLATLFETETGYLMELLHDVGYAPEDITAVCLTHLHPDHAAGLLLPDGSRAFPNATIYVPRQEVEFWMSEHEESQFSEDARIVFSLARKFLQPYIEMNRICYVEDQQMIADGVRVIAAHGHTPGHSGYFFSSRGEHFLVWGDVIHNHTIQFKYPEFGTIYDICLPDAIASRKRLYKEAAEQHYLIGSAHISFPGLGYVERIANGESDAYVWHPIERS